MKRTIGEKIFLAIDYILLSIFVALALYPVLYVMSASISDPNKVAAGLVTFLPKGFELSSYKKVFEMDLIWTSYLNTVLYAVVGTLFSMTLTILGGYALSKKRLVGRKFFMLLIVFTMWFQVGLMPNYLNIKNLGLLDTRLGVVLIGAMSTFNLILMRTFFESVPDSMEESAKMDGANDFIVLFKIYLPLSLPAIATLTLYYFVGRWNTYFWPMIILKDQYKVPLQVLLKKLIVEMNIDLEAVAAVDVGAMTPQTVIFATIVISTIPMLLLYPFMQKHFVKGIMVGAIKG